MFRSFKGISPCWKIQRDGHSLSQRLWKVSAAKLKMLNYSCSQTNTFFLVTPFFCREKTCYLIWDVYRIIFSTFLFYWFFFSFFNNSSVLWSLINFCGFHKMRPNMCFPKNIVNLCHGTFRLAFLRMYIAETMSKKTYFIVLKNTYRITSWILGDLRIYSQTYGDLKNKSKYIFQVAASRLCCWSTQLGSLYPSLQSPSCTANPLQAWRSSRWLLSERHFEVQKMLDEMFVWSGNIVDAEDMNSSRASCSTKYGLMRVPEKKSIRLEHHISQKKKLCFKKYLWQFLHTGLEDNTLRLCLAPSPGTLSRCCRPSIPWPCAWRRSHRSWSRLPRTARRAIALVRNRRRSDGDFLLPMLLLLPARRSTGRQIRVRT